MFSASPTALTSRLLIGALREQDAATQARAAALRSRHMNAVIRSLSHSIEERATRDTVRRLKLIRPRSWSLLEVVEARDAGLLLLLRGARQLDLAALAGLPRRPRQEGRAQGLDQAGGVT